MFCGDQRQTVSAQPEPFPKPEKALLTGAVETPQQHHYGPVSLTPGDRCRQ